MRWLPLLLCASLAAPIGAQRAYHHPVPNCNLAERRTDGGILLRRYQWHEIGFVEGVAGAVIARKAFKLPMLASVSIVPSVTLVLHLHGARHDGSNVPDWAFDALLRAAPAFYQLGKSGNSWQSRSLALTAYAAGYLAGACFASP
jgi:hypothetical protein